MGSRGAVVGSGRAVHVEDSMTCRVAVEGSRRAAECYRGAVDGSKLKINQVKVTYKI